MIRPRAGVYGQSLAAKSPDRLPPAPGLPRGAGLAKLSRTSPGPTSIPFRFHSATPAGPPPLLYRPQFRARRGHPKSPPALTQWTSAARPRKPRVQVVERNVTVANQLDLYRSSLGSECGPWSRRLRHSHLWGADPRRFPGQEPLPSGRTRDLTTKDHFFPLCPLCPSWFIAFFCERIAPDRRFEPQRSRRARRRMSLILPLIGFPLASVPLPRP